ncbi:MAG: hypothetical protein ACRC68_18195 [Clostridium sp.]
MLLLLLLAAFLFSVWKIEYIIFLDCIGAIFAVVCNVFVEIPSHLEATFNSEPADSEIATDSNDLNFISELKEGLKRK